MKEVYVILHAFRDTILVDRVLSTKAKAEEYCYGKVGYWFQGYEVDEEPKLSTPPDYKMFHEGHLVSTATFKEGTTI